MTTAQLNLSLNEVLFFFTRAAVGVGARFGIAEEFGKASVWIAGNGLDPADATHQALDTLCKPSFKQASKIDRSGETTRLSADGGNALSAIQAAPSIADWTSISSAQEFELENVDCPFLIVATMAALNCSGWDIRWKDAEDNTFLCRLEADRQWTSAWNGSVLPEHSRNTNVSIAPSSDESLTEGWNNQRSLGPEQRTKVLESGAGLGGNWPKIRAYFDRCLVPSTTESRESGAGAGMVDTD